MISGINPNWNVNFQAQQNSSIGVPFQAVDAVGGGTSLINPQGQVSPTVNLDTNVNSQAPSKQNKISKWVAPTVGTVGGTVLGGIVGSARNVLDAQAEVFKWENYIERHKDIISKEKVKMAEGVYPKELCLKNIKESEKQIANGAKYIAAAQKAKKPLQLLKAIPKNPITYVYLLTGLSLGLIVNHFLNKKAEPPKNEGVNVQA